MNYRELEDLLRQALGLKITSIGHTTLEMAVKRRMRALDITDLEGYGKKLKESPGEFKELIEEVVIPETWFFRDQEPFNALTSYVLHRWAKEHPSGVIRALSLPCSNGEEPFSIAMALLQIGWPAEKFRIIGADISRRAIARAKNAEYTEHSFRGSNLSFRNSFFTKSGDIYKLREKVRNKVQFHQGNILSALFIERLGVFDVVFCRNLLIYLDAKYLARAINILDRLLLPGGLLFIGHAEAGLFTNTPFVPAPYPRAFAFFKKTTESELRLQEALKRSEQKLKQSAISAFQPVHKEKTAAISSHDSPEDLTKARKLANEGKLEEAAELCHRLLQENGPSAESYYLLGVIHDSRGDHDNAVKALRKTLYLEPNHLEGLVLLSLIAERSGDLPRARNYKRRIQEIQDEKKQEQQNDHAV